MSQSIDLQTLRFIESNLVSHCCLIHAKNSGFTHYVIRQFGDPGSAYEFRELLCRHFGATKPGFSQSHQLAYGKTVAHAFPLAYMEGAYWAVLLIGAGSNFEHLIREAQKVKVLEDLAQELKPLGDASNFAIVGGRHESQ
jgi:hypothetical protein